MEKYLNKGVKEVINQHPLVGEVLEEFGIGCTTCAVGTCRLGDVVGIHNLDQETEARLLYRLEGALYPGRDIEPPRVQNSPPQRRDITYSPPVQELVEEHQVIKRWLALIPRVITQLEKDPKEVWPWIREGVEFIWHFADRYHHAKEEDILFQYADEEREIIQAMYQEHETGRGYVRKLITAIESGDPTAAAANLKAYRELLLEHIRKEDEILYPWIDRILSATQVGELFQQFAQANSRAKKGPEKYLEFLESLEETLT